MAAKGTVANVASAAATITDKSASIKEKASEGLSVGAEVATAAAVSAVASPLAGKAAGALVGATTRSKTGKRILVVLSILSMFPVLALLGTSLTLTGAIATILMAESVEKPTDPDGGTCEPPVLGGGGATVTALTAEQKANAQTIVTTTVVTRGLDNRDAVIAVMTALTESSLINVDHGDAAGPDSTGLFQQRDPWGPRADRMDPAKATGLFLNSLTDPGLKVYRTQGYVNETVDSRYSISPWIAAQSVQRSAYADGSNYQKQYTKALAIVAELTGLSQDDILAGASWNVDGPAAQLPGVGEVINCGTVPDPDGEYSNTDGPGAWGGHANGRIPDEFMCPVPYDPAQRLRCDAVTALMAMNAAYFAQFGANIGITDSYRDYDAQVKLKAQKPFLAGVPGTSNHGWGLALDLKAPFTVWSSPQRQWLAANSTKYGWYSPRWAQQGAKKNEPWHWEFGDSGY